MRDSAARFAHGARQVATVDAELDPDVAGILFAINERRPILDPNVRELAQRQVLAVGGSDQQILDRLHVLSVGLLHADDEIELALALDHLGGHTTAKSGLDQRVYVADVQAVARDFGAVGCDRETRLAKFAHDHDVVDSLDVAENSFHLLGLGLERIQVSAEDLDGERTLQARLGFVDRVLGRLRVVEDDTRECSEFSVEIFDQFSLVVNFAVVPGVVIIRLEPHVKLVVEETRRIGPVVRPAEFVGDGCYLRVLKQDIADLRRKLAGLVEGDGVGSGGTNPERALVEVRHKLRADGGNHQQRSGEDAQANRDRRPRIAETDVQDPAVKALDSLVESHDRFVYVFAKKIRAQYRQQREAAEQRSEQRKRHGIGHWFEQAAGGSGQHVNRKVAGYDNGDGVKDRPLDIVRGGANHLEQVPSLDLPRGDFAEDVLHHDNRAIDDDSEVDGADGEQVCRDVAPVQADE